MSRTKKAIKKDKPLQKFNFHNAVNNDMTYLYALYVKQKNLSSNIGGVYENGKANSVSNVRLIDNDNYRIFYIYGCESMTSTEAKKRFDYRHIICILITLGFLACSVFVFSGALGRLVESGRDFGLSVGYYFCEMFNIPYDFVPTVNDLPKVPFFDFSKTPETSAPSVPIPDTYEGFQSNWAEYWQLWASKGNFIFYLKYLGRVLFIFSKVLLIIIPLVLIAYVGLQRYFKDENNDYDKDSCPLKAIKIKGNKCHPLCD